VDSRKGSFTKLSEYFSGRWPAQEGIKTNPYAKEEDIERREVRYFVRVDQELFCEREENRYDTCRDVIRQENEEGAAGKDQMLSC